MNSGRPRGGRSRLPAPAYFSRPTHAEGYHVDRSDVWSVDSDIRRRNLYANRTRTIRISDPAKGALMRRSAPKERRSKEPDDDVSRLDLKERERYVEFDVRAARKDLRRWGDRLKESQSGLASSQSLFTSAMEKLQSLVDVLESLVTEIKNQPDSEQSRTVPFQSSLARAQVFLRDWQKKKQSRLTRDAELKTFLDVRTLLGYVVASGGGTAKDKDLYREGEEQDQGNAEGKEEEQAVEVAEEAEESDLAAYRREPAANPHTLLQSSQPQDLAVPSYQRETVSTALRKQEVAEATAERRSRVEKFYQEGYGRSRSRSRSRSRPGTRAESEASARGSLDLPHKVLTEPAFYPAASYRQAEEDVVRKPLNIFSRHPESSATPRFSYDRSLRFIVPPRYKPVTGPSRRHGTHGPVYEEDEVGELSPHSRLRGRDVGLEREGGRGRDRARGGQERLRSKSLDLRRSRAGLADKEEEEEEDLRAPVRRQPRSASRPRRPPQTRPHPQTTSSHLPMNMEVGVTKVDPRSFTSEMKQRMRILREHRERQREADQIDEYMWNLEANSSGQRVSETFDLPPPPPGDPPPPPPSLDMEEPIPFRWELPDEGDGYEEPHYLSASGRRHQDRAIEPGDTSGDAYAASRRLEFFQSGDSRPSSDTMDETDTAEALPEWFSYLRSSGLA